MEPLTHAVAGLLIGSKSDGGITLQNGALIASTIGSVIPDLDIVFRYWGDLAYLKQHRGFSHSVLGLALASLLIGGCLSFVYPSFSFATLFFWAFLGALSHTGLDYLNSYGVEICGPFNRKKWTANLFMLFDPIFIILMLILTFAKLSIIVDIFVFASYLLIRWRVREWAWHLVKKHLSKKFSGMEITILPSVTLFFRFDFIASGPQNKIVGYVDLLQRKSRIIHQLKQINNEIEKLLNESILGEFFKEFTPFYHVQLESQDNKIIGHFIDLRYRCKNRFLHNGTLVLDENMDVLEAVFQPFSLSRKIYLNQI